ncbi:MAG: hypothetical protein AAF600_10340 [Bacteroidota bacterium]
MKLIIRIIVIGVLTYFLSSLSAWWIAMVIPFFVCFAFPSSSLNAFVAGFLGVGLTWMGYSWILDAQNESAFSYKIAAIMQVGDPLILVLAAGIIGGFASGFSAISGTCFRQLFIKPKQKSLYT